MRSIYLFTLAPLPTSTFTRLTCLFTSAPATISTFSHEIKFSFHHRRRCLYQLQLPIVIVHNLNVYLEQISPFQHLVFVHISSYFNVFYQTFTIPFVYSYKHKYHFVFMFRAHVILKITNNSGVLVFLQILKNSNRKNSNAFVTWSFHLYFAISQ